VPDPSRKILIVDDDKDHAEATAEGLEVAGFACETATSGTEAIRKLDAGSFDLVLADLVMHDVNGIDVLRRAKARRPDVEVIMMTGYPSYETAIAALNEGAYDYVDKPINIAILRAKIGKALERQSLLREMGELKRELGQRESLEGIIGRSPKMQEVFRLVRSVAPTETTVLILGESGTGKELIARAIHHHSARAGRRFVAINCASLPENLLESELFGHERGAFTGAVAERKGRFQYADGGTLFLDEIGDMPLPLQAKLLRAIEHGEVTPVGSNEPLRVNVRVLSATHRDLEKLVAGGRFREDLYFRINVVRIELPALRERMDDLPLLVSSFLQELSKAHGRKVRGLTQEALTMLYRHRWPGNVRELRNTIESMVVMARGETLEVGDVPRSISGRAEASAGQPGLLPVEALNLEEVERELIQRALLLYKGNRKNASKALGIGERTLYRKMKEYGLE